MLNDSVTGDGLNRLFTVIMVLDRDLKIVHSSDCLRRHLPQVADAPSLTQLFEIRRPAAVRSFEDLSKKADSLCLMITHDGSFAVRGQFVEAATGEGEHLLFLGSPWLSWMHINRPGLDLSLRDFAPQDAQMDQLFHVFTERRMVEDLERLNQQLEATTDQLQAAQEAKSAFFARMSHEMRTPLNGVISALTLLQDEGLTGQGATVLKLAAESSRNLMQVINYVLDVSRLEFSQPASQDMPFDLPELISSVISIVGARAMEKGLALRSHVDGQLSSAYLGDGSLLKQCLLNLVINAINFTDRGTVDLAVMPALDEGMSLRIEVRDTGIGIAPADQAMIFEPFRRVQRDGSVERGSGTGLGLDIARRNVRHMGGRIGVESTLGAGSTFWLELPCKAASSDHTATPTQAAEPRESQRLKGRVLLVDDNDTNLMLGEMILRSIGTDVVCATSGEAAIAAVRKENPDLVLMDISMPGIDGFEAARQIRRFRAAGTLPIVALTAFASSIEREMSEACGMDGYLTKPIVRDQLVETLSALLPANSHVAPSRADLRPADTRPSAVDHAVLDHLAGQIGNANLIRVMNKFMEEVDQRWAALEGAATKAELAREAHTLASTCRSFGLPSIGEKIACIEQHAKLGEGGGQPPCIVATREELLRGVTELKAAMERYQAHG